MCCSILFVDLVVQLLHISSILGLMQDNSGEWRCDASSTGGVKERFTLISRETSEKALGDRSEEDVRRWSARRLVAFLRTPRLFSGLSGPSSTFSKLRLQVLWEICRGVKVKPVLSGDRPLVDPPKLNSLPGGVQSGLSAMGCTESTLKLCT
jgi:hypothetical protein